MRHSAPWHLALEYKNEPGSLKVFLCCPGPVFEEQSRPHALVFFFLFFVGLLWFCPREAIWLRPVRRRLCSFFCKSVENWSYITEGFINIHTHQMSFCIDSILPQFISLSECLHHPHIAIPVLFPSHADGQIIGAIGVKQFREGLWAFYSSTVTSAFFAASSSEMIRCVNAA